jgi:D-alanyl-lipoteichoic acid acyltransferase DltB (MBOAT superfamily)
VLFPTVEFGVFFPIVFLGNWLLRPHPGWWRAFMLAASYVFYASFFRGDWIGWGPKQQYPLVLAGLTVVNQVCAEGAWRAERPRLRRAWVVAAVVVDVGTLAWFKYYDFLRGNLADWGIGALPALDVFLPVGISFLVFQALSYVIDVGRSQLRPARLVDLAVYLSFFPHVMAGPLVRGREILPQLRATPDPRAVPAAHALRLIATGLIKKVVVAGFLAGAVVDDVFAAPEKYGNGDLLLATYGYAIQIYADFSGYTDMAIGFALLLGIRFPQNFDAPYRSASVQEFWRRWHMTLSRWLRDYVYIPLGGNRKGARRTSINLFLVMLIGGLWHGADWKFVIWGGLHGTFLLVERWWWRRRGVPEGPEAVPWSWRRWLVTFHLVCLAWVFFNARSTHDAFTMLGRLLTHWQAPTLLTGWLVVVIVGVLALQFVPARLPRLADAVFSRAPVVVQGATVAAVLLVVDRLGDVTSFIYQQF